MTNFKFIGVVILGMVLVSLFSAGCKKDPIKPPPPPEELVTTEDVVYTPANYENGPLEATIFKPDASISNGVGIVMATGWLAGDSDNKRGKQLKWAEGLANNGYIVMSIDFIDILEGAVYPEPVRAFKLAVEFLRQNSAQYGITTGKIAGFGRSHAAMYWGQSITWDNDDSFFQTDPVISDKLDAAILFYGAYDMNNFINKGGFVANQLPSFFSPNPEFRSTKGNPVANVSNIDTPVLLIAGQYDVYFMGAQAEAFHDSLQAHGKASNVIIFPDETGYGFGFDMVYPSYNFSQSGFAAKDSVVAFLKRTLNF